jgi:predicted phage terminase large subunit-like protein
MVLREWLRYWTPGKLPEMDYLISSWDCTFRKTVDSDYVSGQVWGAAGPGRYLLDQVHRKMNVPDMIAAIRESLRVWPDQLAIVIEAAAAGPDVAKTLEREIHGIQLFKPGDRSKQERLHATLPTWEQGHVYLPHPRLCSTDELDYSWVSGKYIPELMSFPGGMHDDQVDATSQALLWIAENGPGDTIIAVLGS